MLRKKFLPRKLKYLPQYLSAATLTLIHPDHQPVEGRAGHLIYIYIRLDLFAEAQYLPRPPSTNRWNLVTASRRHRPPQDIPATDLRHCLHGTHAQLHSLATYASNDAPSKYPPTLPNSLLSDQAPPRPTLRDSSKAPSVSAGRPRAAVQGDPLLPNDLLVKGSGDRSHIQCCLSVSDIRTVT